jgi:hypothetical protein
VYRWSLRIHRRLNQYTVSQSGLQNVTHSDTQTILAQGNVSKPVQPSGRHYVSLPTDTQPLCLKKGIVDCQQSC